MSNQPETDGVGGYVRWRPRMVRESIHADLVTTLTNSQWMGTSTMPALKFAVTVKDFFPEFSVYAEDDLHINTLTLDNPEPMPLEEWELGGAFAREYRQNMAFYAQDNGIGQALFSDLADRYQGLTDSPFVGLWDYNHATPVLTTRMEVLSFQYLRAPLDVAPFEHHLFFAELCLRDIVDQNPVRMPSP